MTTGQSTRRRWRILLVLERWIEPVMIFLGLAWLGLLVVEFVSGLSPWMAMVSTTIWIVFLAEFVMRLAFAPRKGVFLRHNIITLIALALPALRVLRIARVLRLLRLTRGLRLVRLLATVNRGMRSLGRGMRRRGAGYVAAITVAVVVGGGAGMMVFEGTAPEGPFTGFGEALWWTAMLVTTLGSDYWPVTVEGRILCLLLSVYAVGVFGYLAGVLASVFVGARNAEAPGLDAKQAAALHEQILELRSEIRALAANRQEEGRA